MKGLYILFIIINLIIIRFIAIAPRSDFWSLFFGFGVYLLLYFANWYFLNIFRKHFEKKGFDNLEMRFFKISIDVLIVITFNIAVAFSVPNLSDDVYRFVWDGACMRSSVHPLAFTPTEILNSQQQLFAPEVFAYLKTIYPHLNSPDYYTVYPSVLQFIFWVCSFISSNNLFINILCIKFIFIIFNIGSFLLLRNILKKLEIDYLKAFFFAAHPLVLFELSGNVHGEAVAIFFVLAATRVLIFLKKENTRKAFFSSSIFLALAIATKLLPLIFLPFFAIFYAAKIKSHAPKTSKIATKLLILKPIFQYFSITLFFSLLLLLPFFGGLSSHLGASIDLYFQKFEYNASIYYALGFVAKKIVGYNLIAILGPSLSLISGFIILLLVFKFFKFSQKKELTAPVFFRFLLCAITVYFLFATTVHPWYLSSLVAFGVFTNLRFPMIWAMLSMLTYYNYNNGVFEENTLIVGLEYGGLVLCELLKIWEQPSSFSER